MMKSWINILGMIVFSVLSVKAEVRLPAIFSDNMVLQQQSQVAIWGWSKPGKTVHVKGSWDNKNYSATCDAKGYWKVKVQTPVASYKPYTLTVSDGKAIRLNNVLIGEVWFCSGQSNMEMPMKGHGYEQPIEGGPEDILHSTNKGIRCFTTRRIAKAVPQEDCEGTWEMAGLETTPDFTAAGYYFARLINETLDIPVGIINSSYGGSRIETWMTPSSLEGIPGNPIPQTDADIKVFHEEPTVLYNAMIHPLVGYGLRGVLWYQGEAHGHEPFIYATKFERMVNEWRRLWGIGEFPFYYCQIAPFYYNNEYNSALVREAQAKGMEVPNTGMAVLMDSNSNHCIHPAKKKMAGERLGFWALAKTYGMDIPHRSPEVQSVEMEGRVAVITFEHTGNSGLTSYGKEINNFTIAGEDKHFYPAKAAILGNKVYVFSPNVKNPVAVRYCFDDTSATEIFTVEGNLPLSSFRTDNW